MREQHKAIACTITAGIILCTKKEEWKGEGGGKPNVKHHQRVGERFVPHRRCELSPVLRA